MECRISARCSNLGRCCYKCRHNPDAVLENFFDDRGYIPVCGWGHDDCIYDPARILYEYEKGDPWVRKAYTKDGLEEMVEAGCLCEDMCYYDDEDK